MLYIKLGLLLRFQTRVWYWLRGDHCTHCQDVDRPTTSSYCGCLQLVISHYNRWIWRTPPYMAIYMKLSTRSQHKGALVLPMLCVISRNLFIECLVWQVLWCYCQCPLPPTNPWPLHVHLYYSRGSSILLLYVDDDIIIRGLSWISNLQRYLKQIFYMTDLGRPSLAWNSESLMRHIQQWRYAEYLISMAHFPDSWIADTPLELNVKYWINDGNPLPNPTLHLRLMGSLIYLTMTIPDTAHAISDHKSVCFHPL